MTKGRPHRVYCKETSGKGRGVFAVVSIKKGTVIEQCEVIFFPKREIPHIRKTVLDHYYYLWKGGSAVIPLGFGLLYNHSVDQNAEWKNDYKRRRMVLWATKNIKKDEEITVNYYLKPEDLWFKVIEDKR